MESSNNQNKPTVGGSLRSPSNLLTHSMTLFFANGLGSVLGFVFHILLVRLVGPAGYAEFSVYLAITIILGILPDSAQILIAHFVSIIQARKGPDTLSGTLHMLLIKAFIAAGIMFLAYLVFVPILQNFLHLQGRLGLIVSGLVLFPIFARGVVSGGIQGRQFFGHLGIMRIVESAGQITFGLVLIFVGWQAIGAIGGTVMGVTVTAIYGYRVLFAGKPFRFYPKEREVIPIGSLLGAITVVVVCVLLTIKGDILLAKHFLPTGLAGQYALAAQMSEIHVMTALAVGFALLPKSSIHFENIEKARHLCLRSLGYFLAYGIPTTILVWIFSKPIIALMFGPNLPETALVLPICITAHFFYGISVLLMIFGISIRKTSVIIAPAAMVVTEFIGIALFHDSPFQIAMVLVVVTFSLMIPNLRILFIKQTGKIPLDVR